MTTVKDFVEENLDLLIYTNVNVDDYYIDRETVRSDIKSGYNGIITPYLNIWKFTLGNLDQPLNLGFLKEINSLMYTDKGIYSSKSETTLDERMYTLSCISSIADRAIATFCYIVHENIFREGNNLIAQITTNKILIESNYGILRILPKDLYEFKNILMKFYITDQSGRLKQFLAEHALVSYNGLREEV